MTTQQTEASPKKPMTIQQVADLLGVTYMTVWRMVHSGQIRAIRVSPRGTSLRIPPSEVDRIVEQGIQVRGEATTDESHDH